jgi:gluconolactonase
MIMKKSTILLCAVAAVALSACKHGATPAASKPATSQSTATAKKSTPPKASPPKAKPAFTVVGSVERLDAALNQLIPTNAVIEQLACGFGWTEGPVWMPGGYLLFSDVLTNAVLKWEEGKGARVFLRPSGYTGSTPRGGECGSNGLTRDSQGRLVLCQHGDRCIVRREPNGNWAVLAEYYRFCRFNSPNDLVYDANGNLYFTDPPYGLEKGMDDPLKEMPFQGVYRLAANGRISLLTTSLSRPNGLAFSPDGKKLYVSNSDPTNAVIMVFDLTPDGLLGQGRVFFDVASLVGTKKGLPDGLKVDQRGNLFATGPGGVLVISPAGKHLGTISPGDVVSNCAWGGDGSVLYMTADHCICRIKTSTKGRP